MSKPITVLLVEDNPTDVLLLQEVFRDLPGEKVQIDQADHLTKALALLEAKDFDAVLLDLGLPDSQGLDTFLRLHSKHSDVPVLVLTALEDEEVGLRSLRTGAQDFIIKGRIQPLALVRALRFAVERAEAQRVEREGRIQVDLQLEISWVENLAGSPEVAANAQFFSAGPLRLTHPEQFELIVEQYEAILAKALEERTSQINNETPELLRLLADRLGRFRCSPRDLIEIHTAALKKLIAGQSSPRTQIILAEARLLVLKSMGNLANFYRVGHHGTIGSGSGSFAH